MRTLFGALCGALLALSVSAGISASTKPHCPTEDSCQVDYSHGRWTVTEVQP